ncbi:phytanoyl-CoA dioxygenase PhyH (macronuclear) [Tetrahymena thermophila SB210]|uniref:Phytanoyl-CoA dioxygenase PhyH n=1 Tax=Tetrahymena thermophila (strain SB210) TaxID=312017 RepID=Q22DZ6_TETTS|nr:phytanoyl-CoA dioxygenase PhyH [Tetrahymena thermophila SB210]EAR83516.1 phytanoyl-CoA dioxygenase PhyH [Tetrahymena thermophila SB210]|eukprot:XP_001031179.1 phytanoyl-CoA dioxygenase PhyH [Tetrahymena thermophila SB210]
MMLKRFLTNNKYLFNQQIYRFSSIPFNQIFTENNIKDFQQNGCTLVHNVVSEQMIDELISQCSKIMKSNNFMENRVCFSQGEVETAKSFIDSGDQIGFFFEPNVFDENNKLTVPEDQVLNKMGHALHDLDPVFERFTYRPLLQYILNQLGYQKPQCIQSMYIFKNQRVGTPVPPHTDNTFLITVPQSSAIGFWFALHDATIENGCMWGIQGSHKNPTTHFCYRTEKGDQFYLEGQEKQYDIEKAVPIEVKRGSMFIFHGDFVHFSKQNESSKPRHAYALHFIDSQGCRWHERNWLQRRSHLPFRDYNQIVSKLYSNSTQQA